MSMDKEENYKIKCEKISSEIDNKKYKKAKTLIFDWLKDVTGIRPDRVCGRGDSLYNIIYRFKKTEQEIDNMDSIIAREIVQIAIFSSLLNILEYPNRKGVYRDSLKVLNSSEKYIKKVDNETNIAFYNHFIKLKIYNGMNINLDSFSEYAKNDDEFKFTYIRYLIEDYKASKDDIISLLEPLLNSNSAFIKSYANCYLSYIHLYSNKVINEKIKTFAKESKKIIKEYEYFITKEVVKFLSFAIISQSKIYYISSKKRYSKIKEKLLNLISIIEKENDNILLSRLLYYFIPLTLNMEDYSLTGKLIQKVKNMYEKYDMKYCKIRYDIWDIFIEIIKNFFQDDKSNRINISYYKIVSENYYEYLSSLPNELKTEKNAYNFIRMGNVFERMNERPEESSVIFEIIKESLKTLVKNPTKYEEIKSLPMFKKTLKK